MATYIQRLRYGSATVSHFDAFRWATQGSARNIGRKDIGTLGRGMLADIAMFKLDEIQFSGSHDPLAALVLCGHHRADRVMVNGEWRVVDGELVDVDKQELMVKHRAAARKLADKAQQIRR